LATWERIGGIPELHDPPVLLIAGRLDVVKAMPAAVFAAGLVNRTRPVSVATVCPAKSTALDALALTAKVQLVQHPWMEWEEFQRFLREQVSVTVHPSLTDARPHIPLDSLCARRPVVGSSVSFLPDRYRVDPNSPREIADKVLWTLDNYAECSRESLETAELIDQGARREFLDLYERLVK
jgi:glycosyltransferase involved in cell wall biosynthesis